MARAKSHFGDMMMISSVY